MNWDQIKDDWKKVQVYWKKIQDKVNPKLDRVTNEELMQIGVQKDELVGKLQKRYSPSQEQAPMHVDRSINKT